MKRYKRKIEDTEKEFTRSSRGITSLIEAVYRPDKYVDILYNQMKTIIKTNSGKKFKYNEKLVIYLSEQFREFNIGFDYSGHSFNDGDATGINVMVIGSKTLDIVIYCSPSIEKLFIDRDFQLEFLSSFKQLIGHELIHRSQFISVENYRNQIKINRYNNSPKYQTEVGYFADKAEVMSYAWQIIEELRFQGANDRDILEYIKDTGKHPEYHCMIYEEIYLKYYRNTTVVNQLIKYIYEYLKGNIRLNVMGVY
jgi:hypothetical protein